LCYKSEPGATSYHLIHCVYCLLSHILQLFADSRVSYLSIISKVLDYSLEASRDERIDRDYLYRDNHQEADDYSPDYVAKRQEEKAAAFMENTMNFENDNIDFASGSNLHPSIGIGKYRDEEYSSGPSSKRR
jgi:hypothetical protein